MGTVVTSQCTLIGPPHQWGHVPAMHLACGDLLLGRGHGAHVEGVGASDGARAHDARQGH